MIGFLSQKVPPFWGNILAFAETSETEVGTFRQEMVGNKRSGECPLCK